MIGQVEGCFSYKLALLNNAQALGPSSSIPQDLAFIGAEWCMYQDIACNHVSKEPRGMPPSCGQG